MKQGFSLLECVVVLSCVTLMIGCGFFLYEQCIKLVHKGHRRNDVLLTAYMASTLMMRDCARSLDVSPGAWVVTAHECIWPVMGGHCGYRFEKGRLVRSWGVYNQVLDLWHTRTQALVAHNIKGVSWALDVHAGRVRGLHCSLTTEYKVLTFYCACGDLCI